MDTVGITCWVHRKAAGMDEEVREKLEDAWNSEEDKQDECKACA